MKGRRAAPFFAVFRTEVLLSTKRVAPYAMLALFAGNALLWWGWGPAVSYGWATNSDFYIIRNFGGFSFMTLPLFTAVLMGDPVARDFRAGLAPLLFSKPLGRGQYLAGKFLGNLFVLVCCQSAFPLTLGLLQLTRTAGMIVLPARAVPYVKHFLVIVVVSHALLAAFYFAVGTLTRNARVVYALGASFYPLYVAYQAVLLKGLPRHWRVALDPLLMGWGDTQARLDIWNPLNAEAVNQLAYVYGPEVLANRALVLLVTGGILFVLYLRFSTTERAGRRSAFGGPLTIGLGAGDESLFKGETSRGVGDGAAVGRGEATERRPVALPEAETLTGGARAGLRQLGAAVSVELRLLFAERSLLVLLPLSTLASVAGLAYFEAAPDPSYSAAYAARTADSFLLFMAAVAVFYTGESLHRDRELRIEPVLWSMPAPNSALLLSKFVTNLLLTAAAAALVGVAGAALQLYKGHTPVEPLTYFKTYSLVLLPGAAFMIAAAAALNVTLRDKYLAHAACIALGGGLFYLYTLGLRHPLYNPLLYGLWTPADLQAGAAHMPQLLTHRLYTLALAALCLSLAHLFYGRLSGRGRAVLSALASAAAVALTGWLVFNGR